MIFINFEKIINTVRYAGMAEFLLARNSAKPLKRHINRSSFGKAGLEEAVIYMLK